MDIERVTDVADYFSMEGDLIDLIPFGSGHINDTFCVTMKEQNKRRRYILQRMNKEVFKKPDELMENIIGVTKWLRKKILEQGGDPERETLNLVPDRDGKLYHVDADGDHWRVYLFVEDTTSYDKVEKPEDFYESAVSFGKFQGLLADYPAATLHETIPDFHNTVDRFAKFQDALKADAHGRAAHAKDVIQFVLDRETFSHVLMDQLRSGRLPIRVTHNDTKLNNILMDNATGKGICVIDLDTVMPGLVVNDFGDSIRFGANTGEEDERDLSKVSCDLRLFEMYTKGFIEGCDGKLTKEELDCLTTGAMMMTFECGMRFLTDYLEGDHYFKIHREGHNLDRARCQFALLADMEKKLSQMEAIVEKYKMC